MTGFLLANWRWLLPAIAALGFAVDAGWQHLRVAERDVTIANMAEQKARDIAAAEAAVRKAADEDAARNHRLLADYAGEVAGLQENLNASQTALARAQKSSVCIATPAYRAFIDGLPALDEGGGKAGAGQPAGTGRAGPRLPAPAR